MLSSTHPHVIHMIWPIYAHTHSVYTSLRQMQNSQKLYDFYFYFYIFNDTLYLVCAMHMYASMRMYVYFYFIHMQNLINS